MVTARSPGRASRNGASAWPATRPASTTAERRGSRSSSPGSSREPGGDLRPPRRAVPGAGRVDHPGHHVPDQRVRAGDSRPVEEAAQVAGRARGVVARHEAGAVDPRTRASQEDEQPGVRPAVQGIEIGHPAVLARRRATRRFSGSMRGCASAATRRTSAAGSARLSAAAALIRRRGRRAAGGPSPNPADHAAFSTGRQPPTRMDQPDVHADRPFADRAAGAEEAGPERRRGAAGTARGQVRGDVYPGQLPVPELQFPQQVQAAAVLQLGREHHGRGAGPRRARVERRRHAQRRAGRARGRAGRPGHQRRALRRHAGRAAGVRLPVQRRWRHAGQRQRRLLERRHGDHHRQRGHRPLAQFPPSSAGRASTSCASTRR